MFGGIPFEHFAQGGMGGGMPGGRGRRPASDADTTALYKALGLSKTCSENELRKAYLKLSRTHHPDKGGDETKFKEINTAYNLLKDPEKRAAYDKYGMDGVDDDARGGSGGGQGDIFDSIFGGRRGGGGGGPKKGPPINHPLKVGLQDIFNGKTVKLAVNRKVIVGDVVKCESCNGQGQVMQVRQIGPGMIQQMQSACDECAGQGNMCKTKNQREVLEVHVEKGVKDGHKITFRGKGDEVPNMEAGDINFIVQVKEHDMFMRKSADLLITKKVSLNQAICGFSYKFTHLDGRVIVIKTKPGEIIQAEANSSSADMKMIPFVKQVPGEGLPSQGNPFVRGNLYVLFRVTFPTVGQLSATQIQALKTILPNPDLNYNDEEDEDEVETLHMEDADLKHFGKGGAAAVDGGAYDSDDEGAGGQPVQCAQS